MKSFVFFIKISQNFVPKGPIDSIGLDNVFVPNRRQNFVSKGPIDNNPLLV